MYKILSLESSYVLLDSRSSMPFVGRLCCSKKVLIFMAVGLRIKLAVYSMGGIRPPAAGRRGYWLTTSPSPQCNKFSKNFQKIFQKIFKNFPINLGKNFQQFPENTVILQKKPSKFIW